MDDDQETYITERTSVPSVTKRVSFPESIYPAKDPHSLQYVYNQLPDNGVPLATQYKQAKEQEKKKNEQFISIDFNKLTYKPNAKASIEVFRP